MDEQPRLSRCGAWTVVVNDGNRLRAFPLRCRSWDCERCGPAMSRRLRHLISLSPPSAMLTLTCDTKRWPDPRRAYIAMNRAFPLLVKRLRRDHPGQPLEYLAVWESTKAGWPHLHVLIKGPFLPQRLVSRYWRDLMHSPIVHITAVESSSRAAAYVAKYLTKGLQAPPGIRRWRASAGFFAEPFRPKPGAPTTLGKIRIVQGTVHDVVWQWFAEGLWVRPLPDGTATAVTTTHLDYAHATATDAYRAVMFGSGASPPPSPGPE